MATFADDWAFCTGEQLPAPEWFPPLAATDEREAGTVTGGEVTGGDVTGGDVTGGEVPGGEVGRNELTGGGIAARGIAAGPDEDFERIRYAILAALSQAQRRIRIVSPYFVPEPILMTSLALAAMRGVEVEICVPRRNNLRLVQWASRAKVGQLLAAGCRVWQTPPPFDHSKLMTVDGTWSLIGSANWDQRSLRLNFEFNVECYDKSFAAQLDRLIDEKKAASRPLLLEQIETRSLAVKLRDGAAWLLSPYL
jgi:cardiolipin synthase